MCQTLSDRCAPVASGHATATPPRMVRNRGASLYSITSSARSSSPGGIVSPSDFAVLRLMLRWNLVGCSTGSSLGLAP